MQDVFVGMSASLAGEEGAAMSDSESAVALLRDRLAQVERERDEARKDLSDARAVIKDGFDGPFAIVEELKRERDEARASAVDHGLRSHGIGQESAITDVNAGRIDDLIAPRLARAREEQLEPFADLLRWPSVLVFARAMVANLVRHEPKKGGREGWCNDNPGDLCDRVDEEAAELRAASRDGLKTVLSEAADVANMAMMVADAHGAMETAISIEEGRPLTATPLADRIAKLEAALRQAVEAARAVIKADSEDAHRLCSYCARCKTAQSDGQCGSGCFQMNQEWFGVVGGLVTALSAAEEVLK